MALISKRILYMTDIKYSFPKVASKTDERFRGLVRKTETPMADIANMAHVQRWHASHVSRPQTLEEHVCLVTMYAHKLLQKINRNHSNDDSLALVLYALYHDLSESVLGDLPTPSKRYLESMFPVGQSPLDELEEMVCPEQAKYTQAIKGTYLAHIGKLSDILDALHFIGLEGKGPRGNMVFKGRNKAFDDLVNKAKSEFPEYDWDAAHVVRDELLNGQCTEIEFVESFQK